MSRASIPTDEEILGPLLWIAKQWAMEFGSSMSVTSAIVIMHLFREPGLSQQDVAERSGLSKFAVSRACRSLSDAGAIQRLDARSRGHHHALSPRGERFFRRILSGSRELIRRSRQAAKRRASAQ